MDQRSPEWFAARLGKVTASRIADIVARTKSGWGASRGNYCAELVVERLTGAPFHRYVNAAMQWGIDTEDDAKDAYEFFVGETVEPIGFVDHPTIAMAGASPDGLVGQEGLVEIKCPETKQHIETLLSGTVDHRYQLQMQWQMACTGRAWCDFVSFDPRMPESMQFFRRRIYRDDAEITRLEKEVAAFLKEVESKVYMLRLHYEPETVAA